MNELLESLVGKTLNLPKEQLAGILYEPDGTTLKADAIEKLVEDKLRENVNAEIKILISILL